MTPRIMLPLALLAALAAGPAAAASAWNAPGQTSSASASARDVYRDNLVGCISRLRTCERSRLSQEDRDYLTYEMRDQRFSSDVVQQVADVRMEIYGRPLVTVQGRSTGTRYPAARPEPAQASSGQGGSNVIGLAKGLGGLAEMGGELVKRISAQGE